LTPINENNYRSIFMVPRSSSRPQRTASSPTAAPGAKRTTSEALLGPGRELVIVHNGREYRLRLTQNGKLILTA
jgi:hemin uptake protein HemP